MAGSVVLPVDGGVAGGWGCCRRHAAATAAGSPMPPFADGNQPWARNK